MYCTYMQSGEPTSGITGFLEVSVDGVLVHSKKVTENFNKQSHICSVFDSLSRMVMATSILRQSFRRSKTPLLPNWDRQLLLKLVRIVLKLILLIINYLSQYRLSYSLFTYGGVSGFLMRIAQRTLAPGSSLMTIARSNCVHVLISPANTSVDIASK